MLVLGGNNVTEMFTECQQCLENNMLEENTEDQEKVCLLCLSSYVENYCRMNISDACL